MANPTVRLDNDCAWDLSSATNIRNPETNRRQLWLSIYPMQM